VVIMPIDIQVVFDAAEPAKLAEFWAVALDYQLEPPPPGFDSWEDFARKIGLPEERWGDFSAVIDAQRAKPRLFFQKVPEGKTAKNRVHLDLNVSAGAPDKEEGWRRVLTHQNRLVAAGATVLYEHNEPTGHWMVMQDPEGNEFCIQ
jgi:glyoxalase superfamily protein